MDDEEKKVEEAAPKYKIKMAPETYLEWERKQESKHEYVEGRIVNMAGASPDHNFILSNVIGNVWNELKQKPCNIYPSDLRVFIKAKASYFYPDATIVCGDPETSDAIKDTVTNPSVIFEILSSSTENYDLGRKFFFYMQIASLREYITIDSSAMEVHIRRKQPDNSWKFQKHSLPGEELLIATINFKLPLKNIYEGITFTSA